MEAELKNFRDIQKFVTVAQKKKKMAETLSEEIIKASEGSAESYAFSKKNEAEKQADGAR